MAPASSTAPPAMLGRKCPSKCWSGTHFLFEIFHIVACFMIWNFMDEHWNDLFQEVDEACGITNSLSHALGGDELRLCTIAGNVNNAITVYLNGPWMAIVALIVACTAAMIAFVAPTGQPWQYSCYSCTNIGAILVSVGVGLYLYEQYREFMQYLCDSGVESACPGYNPPPPPPSSSYSPPPPPPSDVGDALWRMANDKDGAQVLWVCFTHFFISIFRPVASFMLCCCKGTHVPTQPMQPQQMQMEVMQPQMLTQPMQPQQMQVPTQPMQPQPMMQQPLYQPPVVAELTSGQQKLTSLPELLATANLSNFESAFVELGAVEVADLQHVLDEDMAALGMKPLEIKRLRRVMGS